MSKMSIKAENELKKIILAGVKLPAISFSLRGLLEMGNAPSYYNIVLRELQGYISQHPELGKSLVIYGRDAFVYTELLENTKQILSRFIPDEACNRAIKTLICHNSISAQINQEVMTYRGFTTLDLREEAKSIRETIERAIGKRDVEKKAMALCLCLAESVLFSRSLRGRIESFFIRKFQGTPVIENLERELLTNKQNNI